MNTTLTMVLAGMLGLAAGAVRLECTVVDALSGEPVAARVYVIAADGSHHFVHSAAADGSAVTYDKQRSPSSSERHTSVSAHPFFVELEPGKYEIVVERGKEYVPVSRAVVVGGEPVNMTVRLQRWIDMSRRGWYSGETHVHRQMDELPTTMLAEDLNVALPLTYWVTQADTAPGRGDKNSSPVPAELVRVDDRHVIYPMNTEYEIFTVNGKRHTLGAVFALNHREVLELGVPPVEPVAREVRRQGGLLELDKHNWPWSMMLVPIMEVDLYELTNNHLWRTEFFFRQFGEAAAPYMKVETNELGFTERGWIDFTFQNYYTLLDCGFRMRPTGGTASGVHPVPLGYGRVYVHCPEGFSYDAWIKGLDQGRSFVTTGPMLTLTVNERGHGHTFHGTTSPARYRITGSAFSLHPLESIELVGGGGQVVRTIEAQPQARDAGGYETRFDVSLDIDQSTWLAMRCFERLESGHIQFAHTAPVHIDVAGKPLRPRQEEVDYLVGRIERELARHRDVLPPAAIDEYERALKIYRDRAAGD